MKDRIDFYSGKHFPEGEYQKELSEKCEVCGTNLVTRCLHCGAPVCCPKCCNDNN